MASKKKKPEPGADLESVVIQMPEVAEQATRQMQKQAAEASRSMAEKISPFWDNAGENIP